MLLTTETDSERSLLREFVRRGAIFAPIKKWHANRDATATGIAPDVTLSFVINGEKENAKRG